MHSANLDEIVIILTAAVFVVTAFKYLHLSPVLGYLVAGVVIGPHTLGIIKEIETAKHIAEFGVVFLLFQIGIELTFERLKTLRWQVFGFGGAQFLITGLLLGLIAHIGFGFNVEASVIIGGGLALSSTAIVLKVLSEHGEQSTQVGRLSLSTLILQDLAVIPLLMMVSVISQPQSSSVGMVIFVALLEAVAALVIIIFFGRIFLRPLFRTIGALKSQELFSAMILLVLLGAAWGTEKAGLSLALGAFLAGLMIAETEFRHQVQADILPFKSLLIGLFFMTVGMQLNFPLLQHDLLHIVTLALGLMALKMCVLVAICWAFRFPPAVALHTGLMLAQGGEFAFILFGLASQSNVIPLETSETLMVAVTISMALTPLCALLGKFLYKKFIKDPLFTNPQNLEQETCDLEGHIIVAGFGRVGKTICTLLAAENLNYIVLDIDAKRVHEGRQDGFPIYFGNAERHEVLTSLGISRANCIIIAINDRRACKEAVISIRKMYPSIPIIARAWDRANAKELEAVGATKARAEAFESSLQLGKATLEIVGVPEHEIDRLIRRFRAEGYGQTAILSDPTKIPS